MKEETLHRAAVGYWRKGRLSLEVFWLNVRSVRARRSRASRPRLLATENPIRSENTEVLLIREIMVATMSSLFVALFALLASSFRTRASLQAEMLALHHQLAVFHLHMEVANTCSCN
jgi:hypothetical protein